MAVKLILRTGPDYSAFSTEMLGTSWTTGAGRINNRSHVLNMYDGLLYIHLFFSNFTATFKRKVLFFNHFTNEDKR